MLIWSEKIEICRLQYYCFGGKNANIVCCQTKSIEILINAGQFWQLNSIEGKEVARFDLACEIVYFLGAH